ncbi:MAG: TIGR01777 family oxidoreductase [Sphingobacteriaceae bacterium]|nr:TIGR01777 family oxidoreductase [Sphingobacteriaceae bacterium]
MSKVLITGGSGLVGRRLTERLQQKGYEVVHVGRTARGEPVPTYAWDIAESKLDPTVFDGVDHVVHLAGAGVADKAWSVSRKQEIMNSRVKGTQLLLDAMDWPAKKPKTLISASAIGYYGDAGMELCTEESAPGNDFLADVCKEWEAAALPAEAFTRLCTIRIGIVLSEKGGALPKMMLPFKLFSGSVLGSGKQMMSWIHLDDLCDMIIFLIENENCTGPYNAVAPLPVAQYSFMKALGRTMKRPLWMWVPGFVLKLVLGEMAATVLASQFVSNEKIQQAGFRFEYENVYKALKQLLQK